MKELKDIKLFHGSNCIINKPSLEYSRDNLDFGKGFYVTSLLGQAISYSLKFREKAVVNMYQFDYSKELKIKDLRENIDLWLDFVVANRTSNIGDIAHDLVIGPVADDKVYRTVELYMKGIYNRKRAIQELYYTKPNNQICFLTEKAIDALQFIDKISIKDDYDIDQKKQIVYLSPKSEEWKNEHMYELNK